MKDNNIIKFPTDKVSKPSTSTGPVSFQLENKKVMISASMVSFLFVITLVNSAILGTKSATYKDGGRGIASMDVPGLTRNVDWEHQLASELSKKPLRRGIASIGTTPSLEDDLIIQLLQKQYQVKYLDGKIKEVYYSGSDEMGPQANNCNEFLNEYHALFPFEFDKAKLKKEAKNDETMVQTYELFDKQNIAMAQVAFELDQSGRILSMKVE